jgi:O-antigen/teichoic acid export membrane protein
MVLLLFTHVIAGLVGAVGPLLNMTGHEAVGARAIAAGAVVNLILNLILVPQFGMMGAASATLVAAVVWYSLISIGIYRNTGVRPSVLG